MIVADNFVFLHMLRTGGTFIRYLLRDNGVRFRKFQDKHMGWQHLTDESDKAKPVIIFVRNPWEWYVSLYSFEQQYIPGQNAWACGSFEEVVRGDLAPPQDYFEHFTEGIPEGNLHVGRYESLRDDAERLLELVGCPNMVAIKRRLRSSPPVNGSTHADYQAYYTPELRDYVASRNARYIEQFGYSF
jgi:hypothetical protein